MFTLVIGGAASGKSEYAEAAVLLRPGPRVYLATMAPFGAEAKIRIARHRALRAGKGFETLEYYTGLVDVMLPQGANVLIECMGNLVANELFCPQGCGVAGALDGVKALMNHCCHLTVVTNEVFSGGAEYQGDTLEYLRALGEVNRRLAGWADQVVEVICGLPHVLKGVEQ